MREPDRQVSRKAGADLRESKRTTLIALAQRSPDWARVSVALDLAPTATAARTPEVPAAPAPSLTASTSATPSASSKPKPVDGCNPAWIWDPVTNVKRPKPECL